MCRISPELIEAYLDAKVILTLPPKGFDRWYASVECTVMTMKEDWSRDIWAFFNNELWITRNTFFRIFDDFYDQDFRRHARHKFEEHNEMIRNAVPPEKLLEYSVAEGW